MAMLVIQVVIKQWDKGERSDAHVQARQQIPDRYPFTASITKPIGEHQLLLEQHGDDVMGNRIRYELTDNNHFIIDRFCFDLDRKLVEVISQSDSTLPSKPLTSMNDNWVQCQYKGRYKVYEGGLYYWLYEEITLNACFLESLQCDVFMTSEPERICL